MPPQTGKNPLRNRVPAAASYMKALKSLTPLSPRYLEILRIHYLQPERTTTAAAVAKAMGFKDFRAVNIHYGSLARLVGERLGWKPQEEGEEKLAVLVKFTRHESRWHWIMRGQLAEALQDLGWVETTLELMPGEMPEKTKLTEGAVCRVAVTAYERNPIARRNCLAHCGSSCVVCGFDFKTTYGPEAQNFIHVHHIRMLSEIGKDHDIDPVKDLRPVCPNCHSVIHLKTPPYSIDELKGMVTAQKRLRSRPTT